MYAVIIIMYEKLHSNPDDKIISNNNVARFQLTSYQSDKGKRKRPHILIW